MNDVTFLVLMVGGCIALGLFLYVERSLFFGVQSRSGPRAIARPALNTFKPRSLLPVAQSLLVERSTGGERSCKIELSHDELYRIARAAVLAAGGANKQESIETAFDGFVYELDNKTYKVTKGAGVAWKRYSPLFDVVTKLVKVEHLSSATNGTE